VVEVFPIAGEPDELRSVEIYNTVVPHEQYGLAETHAFKASVLDHVDLLARVDGQVAGSAVAAIQPYRPEIVTVFLTVLHESRGRGAGTALYRSISDWARERSLDTLEAMVSDDDTDSLAFAERRGFVEDRHERGLALRLAEIEPPAVEPPDGVAIATWAERPELTRGMYEVSLEAYPDVPGFENDELESFEDWLAHDMQGATAKSESTFVALEGDEVVGYAKLSSRTVQPEVAHHDITGVKRAWRGRGIARALKARQIAWAKANGLEELRTRNDARNAPIRKLNIEFGYQPAVGRIYLLGPLAT
jgi:GNAT superfamily N-acetyltransferase